MRHQLQRDDAVCSRRVAQTTVEETLHGKSAAANRRTDSETTKDVVTVVDRTGEQRLVLRGAEEKNVVVNGLAKRLARVVVHPTHLVHVFGRKPRLCDPVLFQNGSDTLR